VSNPNAELSSSPAANPTIGSHLGSSDGVKSFGTVEAADAETVEKNGILGRKPAPAAGSKFDVNKLFQMPAAPGGSTGQASSSSSTSNSGFRPNSNQPMMQQAGGYDAQGRPLRIGSSGQPLNPFMPSSQTAPAGGASTGPNPPRPSNGSPSASSIPAQNPRSPIMGHQQPPGTNPYAPGSSAFRPGAPSHNAARGPSSQMGPQGNRAQQVHAYGMHPGQQHGGPGYPGMPYGGPQGYYAYGYYAPESAYSQGQWQTGQGPTPASTPLSPRLGNVSANVGSPAPSHAAPNASGTGATPGVGRPVPNHNNSNYSVSSQTSGPSTPAQAHARPASFQPGQPFTPGHISSPSANLTASANAFVPRAKSSAIKITREDGTAIDLASAAKELKTPGQSAEVLAVPATPTPPAKAQLPSMPVVVRMETEAQKAKRIADLESSKKRKALEEKEEAERKERETARKVKEEAELKEKAEQETAAANEKVSLPSGCAEESAFAETFPSPPQACGGVSYR
jgi:translation initiation factor 4G